jgi:hypothetical protein
MSDIRQARDLLDTAMQSLRDAKRLMVREPPVKRAKSTRTLYTEALRREVRRLARLGKSHHQIANLVGLPNGGRVSEILNGKR